VLVCGDILGVLESARCMRARPRGGGSLQGRSASRRGGSHPTAGPASSLQESSAGEPTRWRSRQANQRSSSTGAMSRTEAGRRAAAKGGRVVLGFCNRQLVNFWDCMPVGVLYHRTINLYGSCVGPGWLAQETPRFRLVRSSEE
jgi:hypothetical protein